MGFYPFAPSAGGGAVASVFGRTGTVTAQSGDYTAAQVGAYPVLYPLASSAQNVAQITAALNALPASGGMIELAPTGTWNIAGGALPAIPSGKYIYAPGTYILGSGSGDIFRFVDTSTYSTRTVNGGGLLGFPVIDGVNMTGVSNGVHCGDILQLRMEVFAQNFTQAGSFGVLYDNANYWTEQLYGRIFAQNCANHVGFTVSGANTSTGSYSRADLSIYINQTNPAYNGVIVQAGSNIYDASLIIRGNFGGSAGALTSAVLNATGTVPVGHPGAGNFSGIRQSRLEIGVETSGGAFNPSTILVGSASNGINNCYGLLDFTTGFTPAAGPAISAIYPFNGLILGDAGLATASGYPFNYPWNVPGGIAVGNFSGATALANGNTIATAGTGLSKVSSTAAVTGLILQQGTLDGQQVVVSNETAFTLTFAVSGTSHVADGISDVIPALTSRLFTYDGNVNLWFRAA